MSDRLARDSRIYVAGHRGLVGSAILRALGRAGYTRLVARSHAELDLTDANAVRGFFSEEKPQIVVLAAAKVGGILANDTHPGEFIRENLAIQTNVIHESWRSGVTRLLFLGSSCIYPRECPQPMREEYLLSGPLEPTNEPYAIAKIAGLQMCAAYNRQYGTEYFCVMPTNLYGIGDNYDLQESHVLPALIRKAHEAKSGGAGALIVWGSGRPRRELLLSDDLADACVTLLAEDWKSLAAVLPSPRNPLINVGTGVDHTIAELADLVCDVVGYQGHIQWDTSKPDGTPRKLLEISRITRLGWSAKINLGDGIQIAYADFLKSRVPA